MSIQILPSYQTQTSTSSYYQKTLPHPTLGNYIYTVILLDKAPEEGKLRKCAKISFYSLGILLSYGSLFPNVKLALSLEKLYGLVTAFGVAFDFGTLGSWGFISMANKILAQPVSVNRKCNLLSTIQTSVKVVLSIGAGWLSRIPSAGVVLVITPDISLASRVPLALLTILGRSWTTAYSLYETLNYLEGLGKSKCNSNDNESLIKVIKHNLESCIAVAQEESVKLSSLRRKELFSSVYQISEGGSDHESGLKDVKNLFQQTISFVKDCDHSNSVDDIVAIPKMAVKVIAVLPPVCLMIQNTLLTKTALDYFINSYDVPKWIFSAGVASTFSWVGIKYCTDSAAKICERFLTMFSSEKRTTFSEKFYPKTAFILQLMAITLSILPYGEVTAVAKYYASPSTWYGWIFIEANFLASFLLLVNAMEDLFIEAGVLRFSESQWAEPEVREAVKLFKKLRELKEVIQSSYLPEIRDLLKEIGPENIKKLLHDPTIDVEQIQKILA